MVSRGKERAQQQTALEKNHPRWELRGQILSEDPLQQLDRLQHGRPVDRQFDALLVAEEDRVFFFAVRRNGRARLVCANLL